MSTHTLQDQRKTGIMAEFSQLLGPRVLGATPVKPGSRMAMDACVLTGDVEFMDRRLIMLWEFKRYLEDGAFQAGAYYGIYWEARHHSPFFKGSCCPVLLVEILGAHMRVSALYWAGRVALQPLTPLLNLQLLVNEEDHIDTLARALDALRAALGPLQAFYSEEGPELVKYGIAAASPHSTPPVPPAPYPLLAGFTSMQRVSKNNWRVFFATPQDSSTPEVVRYSFRYGIDPHRAWAAAGLAPQVHGERLLPGGWVEVRMEALLPEDGWLSLFDFAMAGQPGLAAACAAAREALVRGHSSSMAASSRAARGKANTAATGDGAARYAHGDMRPINIMVRSVKCASGGEMCSQNSEQEEEAGFSSSSDSGNSNNTFEVRFIDFEFAGECNIFCRVPSAYAMPCDMWHLTRVRACVHTCVLLCTFKVWQARRMLTLSSQFACRHRGPDPLPGHAQPKSGVACRRGQWQARHAIA